MASNQVILSFEQHESLQTLCILNTMFNFCAFYNLLSCFKNGLERITQLCFILVLRSSGTYQKVLYNERRDFRP